MRWEASIDSDSTISIEISRQLSKKEWEDFFLSLARRARRVVVKGSEDVQLIDVGHKKIQVIKTVRMFTGLGLKEAKHITDIAPTTILRSSSPESFDAYRFVRMLRESGAKAKVA